jgi:hypothetical protein
MCDKNKSWPTIWKNRTNILYIHTEVALDTPEAVCTWQRWRTVGPVFVFFYISRQPSHQHCKNQCRNQNTNQNTNQNPKVETGWCRLLVPRAGPNWVGWVNRSVHRAEINLFINVTVFPNNLRTWNSISTLLIWTVKNSLTISLCLQIWQCENMIGTLIIVTTVVSSVLIVYAWRHFFEIFSFEIQKKSKKSNSNPNFHFWWIFNFWPRKWTLGPKLNGKCQPNLFFLLVKKSFLQIKN